MTAITVAALVAIPLLAWSVLREEPPPALATTPAVISDIEDTVVATGTLEASQMVSVGAQVSGQIKSLKVRLGDVVKAGDLIAEIDSTTQENDVRTAAAALVSVRAQKAVQLAALKQAELAFERQKMMLTEEATSRAEYENAEATLASTRAQLQALEAQIEQGQSALDTAKANLGYTKIRAPMDGTVVAVVVEEGQTVNAMQAAPTIVKLAKLDTITVSAEISEADVVRVKSGQTAYFTIFGNPEKRYYGKLHTVEPAPKSIESDNTSSMSSASSNSSSAVYYNALFEVPNPDGELRIGMTAQVYVILNEAKAAITIPSAALGERAPDGRYIVRVVNGHGKPESRPVTVGINNNVVAQVLDGLAAGEQVVVGDATDLASSGASRSFRGRPPMMM
jgi:macrolide-specific efflux system membrane fusion protein